VTRLRDGRGPRPGKPLSQQRSAWRQVDLDVEILNAPEAAWWARNVRDGRLLVCITDEPHGLHLSISFRNHRGDPTRYPSWDEVADARYRFLPHDRDFVQHLPSPAEYVAMHDTTFHLHEHPPRTPGAEPA
jgi:hypothetical protein